MHESAIGHLHMELTDEGDVYASMRLPSLVVGTVGGGTSLPQQKECLELIGCAGPGCAHKLAEVIAGFVWRWIFQRYRPLPVISLPVLMKSWVVTGRWNG